MRMQFLACAITFPNLVEGQQRYLPGDKDAFRTNATGPITAARMQSTFAKLLLSATTAFVNLFHSNVPSLHVQCLEVIAFRAFALRRLTSTVTDNAMLCAAAACDRQ